ncbi:hypothetical protein BGZ65_006230, partial [Modicella reniformis]
EEGEKGGEAARKVILGYKGDERYLDGKYLRDESDVSLAKKNVGVKDGNQDGLLQNGESSSCARQRMLVE